jgi:hypothetical protein
MESLQNLLIKYKRKSDETTTHTVMPNKNSNSILKFGHSLHVKNEEKEEFYNILDDLIFNKNINFPITESFNKMTPLILDLDMKYTVVEKREDPPASCSESDGFSRWWILLFIVSIILLILGIVLI